MSLLPLRLFSATSVIEFIIQFYRSFTGTKNIWYNRLCTQKIFKYNIYSILLISTFVLFDDREISMNIYSTMIIYHFIFVFQACIGQLSRHVNSKIVYAVIPFWITQISCSRLNDDINSLIKILTCSFRFHAKASLSHIENVSPVQ